MQTSFKSPPSPSQFGYLPIPTQVGSYQTKAVKGNMYFLQPTAPFWTTVYAASQGNVTHFRNSKWHLLHRWVYRLSRLARVTVIDRKRKNMPPLPLRHHGQFCSLGLSMLWHCREQNSQFFQWQGDDVFLLCLSGDNDVIETTGWTRQP